jgi:hypothetical protein
MTGVEMNSAKPHILGNERGNAMVETIPLLVLFVVLTAAGMGVFGIVHTATLNSIAARTYSFETYRNRTNLYYFREDGSGLVPGTSLVFHKKGWRYQATQNESDTRNLFVATARPVYFGRGLDAVEAGSDVHNQKIYSLTGRNQNISVNPAWIMVGYGICLNATCGN